MDSFKGTKGKWEVYINPESNGFVDVRFPYYATGFIMVIGDVCKDLGKPHEGAIANALLISNAKELLEMLDNIAPTLAMHGETESYEQVLTLIKKATDISKFIEP